MNIRLLKIALLLLLLGAVRGVSAQVQELVTVTDEPVTYTFTSRFAPVIGRAAENGTVRMVQDPTFFYTLTYTPGEGFQGSDDFLLVSFPFGVNVAFTEFRVSVLEAIISAEHDLAVTTKGTPVRIPVLNNDKSNTGQITLASVPVVNAGTAEIVGEEILFTPNPGFVGLTDLNYVICTFGTCDLGTVTINVTAGPGDVGPDTVRVFSGRDGQFIFAPPGATPLSSPENGAMIDSNGVMAYLPDEGFLGEEFLTYAVEGTPAPLVFHVTTLDVQRNKFAVEDRAYAAIDGEVKLNVLNNDLYSVFADCITFGTPRFGSLVETGRKGEVRYTPPAGWSGVDQFTYSSQAPGCEGEPELETVYIFVSDFAPAAEETLLTAPAGIPVQVTYEVPGGEATWSVVTNPSFGALVADPLTGHISYVPSLTAAGQTDAFTIAYCLNADAQGNCQFSSQVPVRINVAAADADACFDDDCVWPGDTNNDGSVDVSDLLPIGLAMGQTGTPRLTLDPDGWSGQYSLDWDGSIDNLNFKHIDANGDQIISALDTQVVMANLGLQHRLRPAPQSFAPFEFTLSGPQEAEAGDLISFDIVAGNHNVIVIDLPGFTFPFNYNNQLVDAGSVAVSFDEDGWFGYGSPILSLAQNDRINGILNAAVTRTSSIAASGYGKVGTANVIVIDLPGFRDAGEEAESYTATFGGDFGYAGTNSGHLDAFRINPLEVTIKRTPATEVANFSPAAAADYLDEKLIAFPNPTSGNVTVHLNGQQRFTELQITDLTGRTLRHERGLDTNHRELFLGDLPNGLYTLTITTTDGVVNRKVQLIR